MEIKTKEDFFKAKQANKSTRTSQDSHVSKIVEIVEQALLEEKEVVSITVKEIDEALTHLSVQSIYNAMLALKLVVIVEGKKKNYASRVNMIHDKTKVDSLGKVISSSNVTSFDLLLV